MIFVEENVTEGSQNLDSSTEQFPHCLHNSKRTAGSSWNRNFAKLSIALKTYNPYKAGTNNDAKYFLILEAVVLIIFSNPIIV